MTYTEFPVEVQIGARQYAVVWEKGLYHNSDCYSTRYDNTGEIKIAAELPVTTRKEHLFSQLFLWCGSLIEGSGKNVAKHYVAAKHIFALVRDNPRLLDVRGSIWEIKKIVYLTKQYWLHERSPITDNIGTLAVGLMFIDISTSANSDLQWITLWHEMLHLVRMYLKYEDDSEEEEERIVEGFAYFLCTLFAQNDMAWLYKSPDEDVDVCTLPPL